MKLLDLALGPTRKLLAYLSFIYIVGITILLVGLSSRGTHIDPAVISVVQLTMLEMLGPIMGYYFTSYGETRLKAHGRPRAEPPTYGIAQSESEDEEYHE